jgi:hypothetical protein
MYLRYYEDTRIVKADKPVQRLRHEGRQYKGKCRTDCKADYSDRINDRAYAAQTLAGSREPRIRGTRGAPANPQSGAANRQQNTSSAKD